MTTDLEWLPLDGHVEQLLILLHGAGADPADFEPLAELLRARFARSAVLAPAGFEPFDQGPEGRQWFSEQGQDDTRRVTRVAAVMPRLIDWITAAQRRTGVGPAATALVGFAQGSVLALEAVAVQDGLAGRVLAFSGRYARLPAVAPALTTIHLLHGAADSVVPAHLAREALEHLGALRGDATLDLADGVGHELHPALIDCALQRLTSYIPQRTWQAALGGLAAAPSQASLPRPPRDG